MQIVVSVSVSVCTGDLRCIYTLQLIGPISYLDVCYIPKKLSKCIREKISTVLLWVNH